jgi:hypothetical protein
MFINGRFIFADKISARRMRRFHAINAQITVTLATPTGSDSPALTSPRRSGSNLRMPSNQNI